MAEPSTNNLTTLARRLRPLLLQALHAAPGVAAVMLNRILLLPADTDDPGVYPKTGAGLVAALAAAASGDVVWIPAGTLAGADVSVPAGVTVAGLSREETVLGMGVALGDGAALERLSVTRAANDASDLVGVEAPASGTARVFDCAISVAQAGAGNAYAVAARSGGTLVVQACALAASAGGDGYAGYASSGALYVYHSQASGSTDPFYESA